MSSGPFFIRETGMRSSKIADDAVILASSGRVTEAYAHLDRAARSGDAVAAFTLANWRLSGQIIRRDLGLARDLFGRAVELGLEEARPIHIALLSNGAGSGIRRWDRALQELRTLAQTDRMAARQLSLLESMALSDDGNPTRVATSRELSSEPRVESLKGFLTADECAFLINRATPVLEDSVVINPATGAFMRDPIRTSRAAAFPFVTEDPAIHAINRRIAAASGTIYEQGEPLQVLSYEPGQEYKLHSDALAAGGNQRILTFLTYLNDDFEGGDTYFPDLELSFRGRSGDAILFANVDGGGRPDMRARHAGRPVLSGRKMLLSKWIRSTPLDLSGPPGRPF